VGVCVVRFDEETANLPSIYEVILLAAYRGEDVGCVALRRFDGFRAEMKRLYVRPTARGIGAGRKLVEAAIFEAGQRGYESLLLESLPSMEAARALYASMGFKPAQKYYDEAPPESLFMDLRLTN
jgi:putative acetyltransferase